MFLCFLVCQLIFRELSFVIVKIFFLIELMFFVPMLNLMIVLIIYTNHQFLIINLN